MQPFNQYLQHFLILCLGTYAGSSLFPLLKIDELTTDEKENLTTRLEFESRKICTEFSALTTKVSRFFRKTNALEVCDLVSFFNNAGYKELARCIKTTENISDALDIVASKNYWTFCNHEILEIIIVEFCNEDKNVTECLRNYLSKFKEYCQRRLAEVPINKLNVEMPFTPSQALYIKMDDFLHSVCVNDIKRVEFLISRLLSLRQLSLVKVSEGCIELTFKIFEEIDNPVVCDQEVKQLHCGIQRFEIKSSFPDERKGIGEIHTYVCNGKLKFLAWVTFWPTKGFMHR